MHKKFIIILFFIISNTNGFCQLKTLMDCKYNSFSVGYTYNMKANEYTKICIEDTSNNIIQILLDTTIKKDDEYFFIFKEFYENEKVNYLSKNIKIINIDVTGIYYINYYVKQKFALIH